MADTTNYAWALPVEGGDKGNWDTILNTAIQAIDTDLKTVDDAVATKFAKAGGSLTGRVDVLTSTETLSDLGDRGVATALDLSVANVFSMHLTGDVALSVLNVPAAGATVLFLRISNGGTHDVTWPASFKFPSGVGADITENGIDVLGFITLDGGDNWLYCGSAQDLS